MDIDGGIDDAISSNSKDTDQFQAICQDPAQSILWSASAWNLGSFRKCWRIHIIVQDEENRKIPATKRACDLMKPSEKERQFIEEKGKSRQADKI